jgi:hypothetical protein
MLVFRHVSCAEALARISAGCYELKPHRVILSRKARYVKTVNGLQGQKTVGVGEHRYRLRWSEGI